MGNCKTPEWFPAANPESAVHVEAEVSALEIERPGLGRPKFGAEVLQDTKALDGLSFKRRQRAQLPKGRRELRVSLLVIGRYH